jgi:hypothetical protein
VRTAIVTAIAYHTGLLRHVFKPRDLKRRKARLESLPLPAEVETAIKEAIKAVQGAVAAASTAATVAAIS